MSAEVAVTLVLLVLVGGALLLVVGLCQAASMEPPAPPEPKWDDPPEAWDPDEDGPNDLAQLVKISECDCDVCRHARSLSDALPQWVKDTLRDHPDLCSCRVCEPGRREVGRDD